MLDQGFIADRDICRMPYIVASLQRRKETLLTWPHAGTEDSMFVRGIAPWPLPARPQPADRVAECPPRPASKRRAP